MRFSDELEKILVWSRDEAQRTGWYNIGPDHFMLAILRHQNNDACHILESLGIDMPEFKKDIDDGLFKESPVPFGESGEIRLNSKAESCLNLSIFEASRRDSRLVSPAHLLLAITGTSGCLTSYILKKAGIDRQTLSKSMGSGTEIQQTQQSSGLDTKMSRAMSEEVVRLLLQNSENWKSYS